MAGDPGAGPARGGGLRCAVCPGYMRTIAHLCMEESFGRAPWTPAGRSPGSGAPLRCAATAPGPLPCPARTVRAACTGAPGSRPSCRPRGILPAGSSQPLRQGRPASWRCISSTFHGVPRRVQVLADPAADQGAAGERDSEPTAASAKGLGLLAASAQWGLCSCRNATRTGSRHSSPIC